MEMKCQKDIIWKIPSSVGLPVIIAIQTASEGSGKYQLFFKNDDNCTLEKIIFTLDEDTSFAARILVKILLRLRIAPEAALKTAKKFYLMTKEFPQGNYSVNSSSNA